MAVSESELVVIVKAITTELQAGMQQAAAAVQSAAAQMQGATAGMAAQSATSHAAVQSHVAKSAAAHQTFYERVSASLSGVSGSIRAYGEAAAVAFAVLAGERVFKDVIESSQRWAFEVENLSRRLGITTQAASVLNFAAREHGVAIGVLEGAYRAIARTLTTNEAAFHNLGIATRDAQGNFLPLEEIFIRTTERLKEFKSGTDQQVAATEVMKRAVGGLGELLRVDWRDALGEAHALTAAFGLQLDQAGVLHARQFEEGVNLMKLAGTGFANVLAQALRPELLRLTEKIIELAKDGTLKRWGEEGASAIHFLGDAVAFTASLFSGAIDRMRPYVDLLKLIIDLDTRAARAIEHALGGAAAGGAGRSFTLPEDEATKLPGTGGTENAPAAVTKGSAAKAEEQAYKDLKATRDADLASVGSDLIKKYGIESDYHQKVLALTNVTKEQQEEARRSLSEAMRRLDAEDAAIAIGHLREELSERTRALDEEKKALEDQLHQGTISAPAFLAAAQELADRRLAIQKTMYAAEQAVAEGNRKEIQAINDKIAAAEAQNARERLENQRKADAAVLAEQKDNAKYLGELFGGLGQGLNTGLESLLDRNKSAADVMRSIWQGLAKDILKILEQIVAKELETLAVEKLITAGYLEGAVSKKTGTLGEQFSGGILNLLTGTKPGGGVPAPAPGGGGVGTGVGAASGVLGGGTDARVAAEQQTQAQLTNLTQHGFLARLALTAAHYAKVGALATLHFIQERAREAVALAKWIATQGIKLAIHIATETGITAVSLAESAVRHAQDIAQVIKSIIAYAYKAAAGAASAVADIPYVGPILAVVNYGIVLGTVLGGASAVSAEGGADLPGGGPFSLIAHKKEMVLPEEHAETIRGLATVVRELVSGRSGGAEHSRITIGGPELSLASIRTSPALERGVAAVHAALTGAGETGTTGGAGALHIHYSALDLPSGKEALRKHAETIHQIVARHSAKQGGGRRHP